MSYKKEPELGLEEWKEIANLLAAEGIDKITLAGGEPTLIPWVGNLIKYIKSLNLTTSIVTNGAKLAKLIEEYGEWLDWVALSVDSFHDDVEIQLGRASKVGFVARMIELAELCHSRGIKVKLNTVVTRLNYQENLGELVKSLRPIRWKIFQILPIKGENDSWAESLSISREEFESFLARHRELEISGVNIVAEDNDDMQNSYIMIDNQGRFFSQKDGAYEYSQPILEVGVQAALIQVSFKPEKFRKRGGFYNWR